MNDLELKLKKIYHILPKIKIWKEYKVMKKEYEDIDLEINSIIK